MISISLVHALAGNGDLKEVLSRCEQADIEALHELVSKPLPTEYKKNVLDALVFLGDSRSASAIARSLPDMDPTNLQLAFDALSQLGDSRAGNRSESNTPIETEDARRHISDALARFSKS